MSRLAPPSIRDSRELSYTHECLDLEEFVEGLPPDAVVFDIGAGASPFGCDVAGRRPDVLWVNVDRRYEQSTHLGKYVARQLSEKPDLPNVHYVPADMTSREGLPFEAGIADRVYCSAVVPHLGRTASRAAHNMAQLLKPSGYMSVSGFSDTRGYGRAARVSAVEYGNDPNGSVKNVVEAMRFKSGWVPLQMLVSVNDYLDPTLFMPVYDPPRFSA
jgi:SAM-dependent methyltransferase